MSTSWYLGLLLHQEATYTIILYPQGLTPRGRVINVAKEEHLSALIYDDIRPELASLQASRHPCNASRYRIVAYERKDGIPLLQAMVYDVWI